MRICLVPYCKVIRVQNRGVILTDENKCYELTLDEDWIPNFISEILVGIELGTLSLQANYHEKLEIVNNLFSMDLLVEQPMEDWLDSTFQKQIGWLAKHSHKPEVSQKKIINSKVVIIGLGGVGAIVLQHLLAAGVENFYLIDKDTVSINNLNRQYIYSISDLGVPKVNCAVNYINKINSKANVKTSDSFIEQESDLKILSSFCPDLIIQCADKPLGIINELIADYCFNKKIAFLNAAIGIDSGYWGPLIIPDKTICFNCFIKLQEEAVSSDLEEIVEQANSIQEYSFGPVNSTISSMCARDALLYLIGSNKISSFNSRIHFDFSGLKFNNQELKTCLCWQQKH